MDGTAHNTCCCAIRIIGTADNWNVRLSPLFSLLIGPCEYQDILSECFHLVAFTSAGEKRRLDENVFVDTDRNNS